MKPAPIDPPEIHPTLWAGIGGTIGYDIGANCGQSLSEMTRRFTQVYAFEPATEALQLLNTWSNRVTILPVAVSDTDENVTLAAIPDKIDTGQLITPGTHGMEWSAQIPAATARSVTARRIDSLIEQIPPPDFMKIDVEGHERHVLAGAARTLATHRPDLLIEFHNHELWRTCLRVLDGHGYTQTATIRHPHYTRDSQMYHNHGWIRAAHPDKPGNRYDRA